MELLLPILRDDVRMDDLYEYNDEPPLDCSIDVFVGGEDRGTPQADADAWRVQTTGEFDLTIFPGGHFFMNESLSALQQRVWSRVDGRRD